MSTTSNKWATLSKRTLELAKLAIDTVENTQPVDRVLTEYFRKHKELGSRDRRFIKSAIFGMFRWAGWLGDVELEEQLGLGYLLDENEPSPVLDELAPNIASKLAEIKKQDVELLAPDWFAEVLPEGLDLKSTLMALQARPPVVLRLNQAYAKEIKSHLSENKIPFEEKEGFPFAMILHSQKDATELMQKFTGKVQIQNLASQAVGLMANPSNDERWWDCCSATGGKTLHLADLAPESKIYATDLREPSIYQLKKRLRQSHVKNVQFKELNILEGTMPDNFYDGILVDAPCSGLGTWARNPDARWRTNKQGIRQNTKKQTALLNAVSNSVKPGGKLIYSVCTFSEQETNLVVQQFLSANPDFHLQGEKSLLLKPQDYLGDSMFIAEFIKNA